MDAPLWESTGDFLLSQKRGRQFIYYFGITIMFTTVGIFHMNADAAKIEQRSLGQLIEWHIPGGKKNFPYAEFLMSD